MKTFLMPDAISISISFFDFCKVLRQIRKSFLDFGLGQIPPTAGRLRPAESGISGLVERLKRVRK
jgi:hypothetical protein